MIGIGMIVVVVEVMDIVDLQEDSLGKLETIEVVVEEADIEIEQGVAVFSFFRWT